MNSSTFADYLTIIVVCIGTIVATLGLGAWKSQMKGKVAYDLARRLLRELFNIRNAINGVRAPYQTAGEIAQAMKEYYPDSDLEFNDPKYNAVSNDAVYKKRWNYLVDAFSEYQVDSLEAEVLWGDKAKEKLSKIVPSINSLRHALDLIVQNEYSAGRTLGDGAEAFRRIIYSRSDASEDDFKQELEKIVIEIENYLRRFLKL